VSNAVAGFLKLDGRWGSRAWSFCGLVFGGLPWRVSGVLSTGLAICSVPNVSEQLPERAVQLLCSVVILAKTKCYLLNIVRIIVRVELC
jgi:hypothetical protein